MQKEELIGKIMEMADLSNDEKAEIVGSLRRQKKYGLVWENHPEDAEERLKSAFPVLREDKEAAIISDAEDAPDHVLIEGDNLEALMALSYTHEGRVDVIYIDPPYNTGNKDFVYNDSFVDSEDGYRHSKWLSFMEKRLRLAKKLLSDKGVIFISIDDNEQANLKLLCDEVFGGNNFISNIVWQSTAGSNTGTEIVTVTENILVYTKFRQSCQFDGEPTDEDNYTLSDEYVDTRGRYSLDKMDRRRVGGHYSEALNFPIEMPDGTLRYPGGTEQPSTEGWNYLWSQTKVQWGLDNGFVVFKKSKSGWNVYNKRYAKVDNEGNPKERSTPYRNLITSDFCSTSHGTAEITSIFGVRTFDFPKPSTLIKRILSTIVRTKKDAIVLDFFAGSGTTLHATMQLNAEDGGHRQCILVTNNENNICRDVTYERNKRVIQGYTTPKGVAVEGLTANNLRYYTMDFLPREHTYEAKRELMRAATDMLCVKEGIYNEVREFCGMKFKPSILRYFTSAQGKRMLLIFDERAVEHIVPLLQQQPDGEGKLKIYVFSNGAYAYEDEFLALRDKVELCALPEALLQVYKQVLPQNDEEVRI
ncbi:MAG: site-specific DNA-methyltransferase [Bacteroidales bacterium]|nr:site-specific DNA-methyltransferase [Bacteroidales bacterium]